MKTGRFKLGCLLSKVRSRAGIKNCSLVKELKKRHWEIFEFTATTLWLLRVCSTVFFLNMFRMQATRLEALLIIQKSESSHKHMTLFGDSFTNAIFWTSRQGKHEVLAFGLITLTQAFTPPIQSKLSFISPNGGKLNGYLQNRAAHFRRTVLF